MKVGVMMQNKDWWLVINILVISILQFSPVESLTCYACSPSNGSYCQPLELYGAPTQCPEGVTVCYKSWSVEADPKTVRRCGNRIEKADEGGACMERLQGANRAIVCKCPTDFCNSAMTLDKVTNLSFFLLVLGLNVSTALLLLS